LRKIFAFPQNASRPTAGIILPEKEAIITGHENGLVVFWNFDGKYSILKKFSSQVETISYLDEDNILIGAIDGNVVILSLRDPDSIEEIQAPGSSVRTRVWRSLWISKNQFITTSTYGTINVYSKEDNEWNIKNLPGHSNSIFAASKSPSNKYMLTGDYFGNIIVWLLENSQFKFLQKLKVLQAVEDFVWYTDESFSLINKFGKIYLFEKEECVDEWTLVYEIDDARSMGKTIAITEDGKTIFAGTNTELIQFDRETHQIKTMSELNSIIKVKTYNGSVFILTSYGLFLLPIEPITVSGELIKYKYLKISLIGHTGVGKTALCNIVTTGTSEEHESTFGKMIWIWHPEPIDGIDRRIVFHDHGGQETVLSTFLPFLSDSDIILILFQQNDVTTFKKAKEIYDMLSKNIGDLSKIFFVQTFIDQEMDEIDEDYIDYLIEKDKICGNIKVCPKDGTGIEDFKKLLLQNDIWEKARTMIQTIYTDAVLSVIMKLQEQEKSLVTLQEFQNIYEKETGYRIPQSHLKFLLQKYSDQGVIEYYPEIKDWIIINDPDYNRLKSEIPIYVMKNNGIIEIQELCEEFDNNKFLPILDNVYLKYKISIENFNLRIFPKLLPEKSIDVPEPYIEYLKENETKTKTFPDQPFDIGLIIEILSELRGQCISLSKHDGLFSWKENVVLYFSFERTGNSLDGYKITFSYRVGGKNSKIYERLVNNIMDILEGSFGPSTEVLYQNKKKEESEREIIYDVALSFAGEQRNYVKEVAKLLTSRGIVVFYDEFFEGKIWGRDLSEYFMDVYYKQSKFCMMFISKEYVAKAWPTYEKKLAIARHIAQLEEYILPIRFDDSEVPGLLPTIKYVKANPYWPEKHEDLKNPEDIVDLFIDRIEPD